MADDRYELLTKLGSGNFGQVYEARQVHLDRTIALKLISISGDPHEVLKEARTLASLPEHDNVVRVTDAGEWDTGTVFIASELCTGGSLDDLVAGPMDPGRACDLISQACRGLVHLHSNNLLHLDLRPANILLAEDVPRLVDFGLARWADTADVEDWYYPHAAPELVETGHAEVASDLYAMAMTLAHLLTGGLSCASFPTGHRLIEESANGAWPRLETLPVGVPTKVRKLLATTTAYDINTRPATAATFKSMLDKVTPAVSFISAPDGVSLDSADGLWRIERHEGGNAWGATVFRGGRRRNDLGLDGVTEGTARKHVAKLVQRFADGAI
jgi:serine/threonine protein kinase